jgi:hypothetical protein
MYFAWNIRIETYFFSLRYMFTKLSAVNEDRNVYADCSKAVVRL